MAEFCDFPVHEAELHSRHQWLMDRATTLAVDVMARPTYFDARAAAYWAWGITIWLGNGWCDPAGGNGKTSKTEQSRGLKGYHKKKPVMHVYGNRGVHSQGAALVEYFKALQGRLRNVRVLNGDWERVRTPGGLSRNRTTGRRRTPRK